MASASASPDLSAYLPRFVAGELADRVGADEPVEIDGTLCFADLSGFTRLAERLKVEGREGAELLTAIVNRAFEVVLEPPLALGGDVMSFGGDSATILFRGDRHANRAVHAAGAMQRALAGHDSVVTGAGRVRLRMSIAVATGPVVVVPAGVTQRAALLVGPTVDAANQLERITGSAQIRATAAVVDACSDVRWRRPADDGADDGSRLLQWRQLSAIDPSVDTSPPPTLVPATDLRRWLAPALHEELSGEPGMGELRRTVVGFVRAAPLNDHPSRATSAQRVAAVVEAAAAEWGVCWLASDACAGGVTFLLTAGSPSASEDDVERMHRTMATIIEDAPLGSVRCGVEQGVVFAGDVGHPDRRCWTVMGDSVNVAARLAADAPLGHVLCGPVVTATSVRGASAELVGRTEVRGRRTPIEVFRVDPVPPEQPRVGTDTPTPFIGRDHELGLLVEQWSEARAGRGSVVDIVGEAGIGKTRLLAELRAVEPSDDDDAGVDQVMITSVRSDEFHGSVPFATASSLVRAALGIDVDAPPTVAGVQIEARIAELAPHLRPWAPLVGDAALARVEMTEAVERLDPPHVAARREAVVGELLETAVPGPWLLLLDDLQWVDPSSRGLLRAVAGGAARTEWLVCVSRRPSTDALLDPESPTVRQLALAWLGPTQAAQLAAAAADPTPLTDAQIARVVAAAAGNPLFLEQLAIHATWSDDELPDTVERLIAARIDTLDPRRRRLLREVSVVGTSAPLDLVARLLDDDDLSARERWEAMPAFIELVGLVLRFRSNLIRTVAHDGLPFARRRALHLAMAEIIAGDDDLDTLDDRSLGQLAWHLLEAGRAREAWPAATAAARRARERGALVEAADRFERALALPRKAIDAGDAEVAATLEEHAEVCIDLGRLDAAQSSLAAAARLHDSPIGVATICSRRAGVELLEGGYGKALRWATKGLGLLDGVVGDEARELRARLLTDRSAARLYQGRHRESLALAEEALAEMGPRASEALTGRIHQHLEMAHSALGNHEADRHGAIAVASFEAIDDQRSLASVLTNMGVTASSRGRWNDAVDLYERAAAATVATGNTTVAAVVTVNRAMLLEKRGEIEEADVLAADAERILATSGHEVFVGYTERLRAIAALWRRERDAASELLAVARARFERHDAGHMVWDCDVVGVLAMVLAGESELASSRADELLIDLDGSPDAGSLAVACRRLGSLAALRLGAVERAVELAARAADDARRIGSPYELALALDATAHAQNGSGQPADAGVLRERDDLLAGLGIRRTLLPLAR